MNRFYFNIFFLSSSFLIGQESFSVYGEPKYSSDFLYFDYVNPQAPKHGEIILGSNGTFDSLNQFALGGIPADDLYLIYDSLMFKSADEISSYYPLIAKDINISDDWKTIKFTIREDVKFSDDIFLTTDDINFTFYILRNSGSPIYKSIFNGIENIEIINKHEILFKLKKDANRDLISTIATTEILPHHFWKDKKFNGEQIPIGSGPYKISNLDRGSFLQFERRENYWGWNLPVNRGRFNFNKIKYDYYRDETVLFEAFKSLRYHFRLENMAKNWVNGYKNLDNNNFIIEEINNSIPQGIQGFFFNTRIDKFNDWRVRKAIALTFDFEWSNKFLFFNQYKRSESIFSNSDFGYKNFILPKAGGSIEIRDNLREAMKLLNDAGYILKNGELISLKNNQPMRFELLLNSAGFVRVSLPWKRNLKKIGIDMTIRNIDISQYMTKLRKFEFDMVVASRGQQMIIGGEQFGYWHSSQANIEGSLNIAGIKNNEVDSAIDEINNASNIENLKISSAKLDKAVLENFYIVPHWHINKFRIAYWKKLHRPKITPKYDLAFDTWWFE